MLMLPGPRCAESRIYFWLVTQVLFLNILISIELCNLSRLFTGLLQIHVMIQIQYNNLLHFLQISESKLTITSIQKKNNNVTFFKLIHDIS